ncbi:MAG: STAS domain-containing protein [bacterium]|nr:STAS domain-containing protein [Candidatus Sumerlaeota bacterium]
MKAFSFTCRETPALSDAADCATFDLRGYIDAHTVIEFEKTVNSVIEAGTHCIILDISGLSYISSAGIGAMMGLTRKLNQLSGELILLNPTPKVYAILDGLGFTKIFKIANSENEAMEKIRSRAPA